MMLPGGIWRDGARHRSFAFRPVVGELELAVAEGRQGESLPARISRILTTALAEVGGESPNEELVDQLSVGDRQFLVRRLACHLGWGVVWTTVRCRHCGDPFDLCIDQGELPFVEAAEDYPFADVDLGGRVGRFHVPTGSDQKKVLPIVGEDQAASALAHCCQETLDGDIADRDSPSFGPETLETISRALEAIAPEVTTRLAVVCPSCDAPDELELDPYLVLGQGAESLIDEIHRLASTYHWGEREILALPRERRRHYLRRIDQSRGMVSSPAQEGLSCTI